MHFVQIKFTPKLQKMVKNIRYIVYKGVKNGEKMKICTKILNSIPLNTLFYTLHIVTGVYKPKNILC